MDTSYVPEIFVLSEKRILSPAFHGGYFVPPSGFSPAAAPTRKTPVRNLRHVPVWRKIRLMCSFAMCRLLLGCFTALKSSLHGFLKHFQKYGNQCSSKGDLLAAAKLMQMAVSGRVSGKQR